MLTSPTIREDGLTVVVGINEQRPILEVVARLALMGSMKVIIGGNRYDAHQLTRLIRRQTVQVDTTLENIQLARPFTCFQAMKLLEQTSAGVPLVAIDLLDTFYDENISDSESLRLVTLAIRHLRRLGQTAPVLITLRPPALPSRVGLIKLMRGAARQVYEFESPQAVFQPPLL